MMVLVILVKEVNASCHLLLEKQLKLIGGLTAVLIIYKCF